MKTTIPTNPRFMNLTGLTFGLLTVVSYHRKRDKRHHSWTCLCKCGNTIEVIGNNLVRGNTTSCGCARTKASRTRMTTHGGYGTPEYKVFIKMLDRCRNSHSKDYPNYGGRGISICDRWQGVNGFSNFIRDMGHRPTPKHTLDRKNNSGNYEPENCRWATNKEQANNKRNTHLLTHNGITQSVTAWEEALGFPTKSIHNRLIKGWSPERALTTPIRHW